MNILSNIGITSGSKVEAWHITQSIDAFTGEQEYDIFLSGSLTITGSLNFTQITNDIYGNSSTSTTSSYSTVTTNTSYALTASSAFNQTIILTFTHPQINLEADTKYYIGNGNITTTGSFSPSANTPTPAGMICPVDGTIVGASITSNSIISGSLTSLITLGINLYDQNYTFDEFIYNPYVYNNIQDIEINVVEGDILTFEIATKTGTLPQATTHNIHLYIKSYV